VRLDHLLSKEHMAVLTVHGLSIERTSRCMPSSKVERRLLGSVACHVGQYNPLGEWKHRDGHGEGRAHCWVLKDQAFEPGLHGLRDPRTASLRWSAGFLSLRTARTLRTAQWTRASLWRQATKCTWWMPWHQEPMKDVGACDKPRGVGNRAEIRGFPNGETQLE
jgi:hypothetical protein